VKTDAAGAVAHSAALIRQRTGRSGLQIGLLLGSGWAAAGDALREAQDVPYRDLPAFPAIGVGGHQGLVRVGLLGGRRVAVLLGRSHAYETGEADAMKGPIRVLASLGVKVLLQTNAAGGIANGMRPGDLMVIADHLNLVQRSPLVREAGEARFVDLAGAYDPALRAAALAAARAQGLTLHEGVYAWVMGPQFETPAEIRMLRALGADAVGMSTVPETLLARHAGLRVLALSMITNMACGLSDERLSHAHTLQTAARSAAAAARLVEAIVAAIEV
jgi:purine-nucleoside phosphorylase